MNLNLDAWTIAALFILAALAFWGVRMLKNRLEEQRYQEHMADLEFEASLMGETGNLMSAAPQDAVFLQDKNHQSLAVHPVAELKQTSYQEETEAIATGPRPQSHLADGPLPADVKAAKIMAKLQHAGFIRGVEGYIEIPGNPKGAAILRLRDGKLALLVPHMESEAFLRHNSRRVDMIIVTATDDTAFVVKPLEQVLAESISL